MKNPKILLAVTIGILILGLVIYFLLPKAINKPLTAQLLKDKVFFVEYSQSQNKFSYFTDKGVIPYSFDPNTSEQKKLYSAEILGITDAFFSPDSTKVIVESDYPFESIKTYDFAKGEINGLNSSIKNIVWSDNNTIYYIYQKPGEKITLNKTNPDGKDWQKIYELDTQNDIFNLTITDKHLFLTDYQKIYKINLVDDKVESILNEKIENFRVSNDGLTIAYNKLNSQKTTILKDGKQTELKQKVNLSNSAIANNNIYAFDNSQTLKIVNLKNKKITTKEIDQSVFTSVYDKQIQKVFASNESLFLVINNGIFKINKNRL